MGLAPIIAVIAVVFTMVLIKKGVNIGLIMLANSVFIVIFARIPLNDALRYAFEGAVSDKTIKLIVVLFLIMMLENIMRTTGMIKNLVESLKELLGNNRLAAAFLPTVLGLLPSPGGARFSCPMIEEVTGSQTDNANKAFINYWFRHIWMDGFILYPGVILAAELLNISVIRLFLQLTPFMVLNILIGYIFGLVHIKNQVIPKTKPRLESFKCFIFSMLPIIVVIIAYICLINHTGYSLEIASSVTVIGLLIIKKFSIKQILKAAKEAFPVKLVIIIIGVMVFKEILLDSGLMDGLPGLMEIYNIPSGALFLVLPFLSGLATGITVSFVSMSFPILISLGINQNPWYGTFAFIAGFIGVMVTPMHLCAVMTSEYFQTVLTRLLGRIAKASMVLAIAVLLVFVLISKSA